MATKVTNGYMCPVCEKVYPDAMKADTCKASHEILYVPLTRTEVNRLIHGLMLGDFTLVPDSVFETLRKVQRANVGKN